MDCKNAIGVGCMLAALMIGLTSASAAQKGKKSEPTGTLTPAGEKLQARYADTLAALQAEITKALPVAAEQRQATFLKAYQDEAAATAAELQAMRAQGGKKVKDRDAAAKAHGAAKEALALAATSALTPSKATLAHLEKFLASDKLDAKLAKCVVLIQATPRGLAEFAQQGQEQEALVDKLLGDNALMKQMLMADGAKDGKYGPAMQIYTAIQEASPKAGEGLFQRLALAVSLEHTVPIAQSNPKDQTDAPATVDPIQRYRHYLYFLT